MPLVSHRAEVQAPAALLWEMLKEKIDHPERFLSGIGRVEILGRPAPGVTERVMYMGTGADAKRVHEIITADQATLTVVFKLVGDPVHQGFVTNTVFEEEGRVVLDFTMNWVPRKSPDAAATAKGPDWQATLRAGVEHTRDVAEARAGKGQ